MRGSTCIKDVHVTGLCVSIYLRCSPWFHKNASAFLFRHPHFEFLE
jgi:hypothetical protein